MEFSLKYSNNALLICNNALSTTCCETPESIYWDAVPCDLESYTRLGCFENNQCDFDNRKYISPQTTCDGDQNLICECQRLIFNNIHQLSQTGILNIFSITYTPPSLVAASINWQEDIISVSDIYNGTTNIPNTGSLSTILSVIDALPYWSTSSVNIIDSDLPGTIVMNGTVNFSPNETENFISKDSYFKLKLGYIETDDVEYYTDVNDLANNIKINLNVLPGYINAFDVVWNSGLSSETTNVFEIIFQDSWCGIPQSGISGSCIGLNYTEGYYNPIPPIINAISGEYGNNSFSATYGYLDDTRYLRAGSGDFSEETHFNYCPYGNTKITDASSEYGPYPYDSTQCCPQKGVTIGPRQSIFSQLDDTYGYNRSNTFDNLENTVVINDQCYKLDPFFFLFGRTGRFYRNNETTRTPYIISDCNYTIENGCDSRLPCNCSIDLFLTQFSKNIPWGPFGAYFDGIEDTLHPAATDSSTYIGANYPTRKGIDYAPRGYVRTIGTWLETKEIRITFSFHRAIPYWMGVDDHDDINLLGQIDPDTISDNFSSYDTGNGCNIISLIYDCNDKTVGEFLNDINAIRTYPTPINPDGCEVFAFCAANDDVLNIPLSKIINSSTELYDLSQIFGVSDGTYDADIDSDLLSGSDIFGSPRPYSQYWPKVRSSNINQIGGAINDDRGVYRRLYNGGFSSSNPIAKYPPYCRLRAIGLPKDTSDTTTRPSRFFAGANFEDQFGLKTPWWQAIQGCNTDIATLYPGSGLYGDLPSYITKVQVNINDRILNIVVNSGITEIANYSIPTVWNSGYKLTDFVHHINSSGFMYGGNVFWPVSATSGISEYDIWLDDQTYWHTTTHEPLNSGDVGAIYTPYNFGYVEPVLDSDTVNLITDGSLTLQSFIRRRCDYGSSDEQYLPPLTGCVPRNATKYNTTSSLDCASDTITDESYVLTYGCSSHVCRTEWYLQASRCSCDLEWSCTVDSGRYIAHKFNREGDDNSNQETSWNKQFSVTQPLLYICEYAIHSQCDIPFLIKVPYQIWGNIDTFPTNSDGIGFECGQSDIAIVYADSSHIDAENEYLGSGPVCDAGILDTYSEPAIPRFLSECEGWCQYIDPITATRVKKEDIPRTWPPTSYIAERGYPVFCSINPYSESIETVCNGGVPTYNWDSIYGVIPAVPARYLREDNGLPCSIWPNYVWDDTPGLRVLTRPIINELTWGDLCGTSDENRIDIGCGTKCCGCFFDCSSVDNIYDEGPKACPCYRSYEYNQDVENLDMPFLCSFIHRNGMYSIQPCNQCITYEGGGDSQPNIYGGTYDTGYSIHFNFTVDICCRTCPVGFVAYKINTYSRDVTGCTGDYFNVCDSTPSVTPPDIACSVQSVCDAEPTQILGCYEINQLFNSNTTSIHTHVTGILTREAYPCSDACVYNLCGRFLDFDYTTDVTVTTSYCGEAYRTWTLNLRNIGEGVSPYDSVNLGFSNDGGSHLFEFTNTYTDTGDITIGVKTCEDCIMKTTLDGIAKNLAYITGWIGNIQYNCNEPNLTQIISSSDALVQYDPECS